MTGSTPDALSVSLAGLENEAVRILQGLLRIDTTNPPGNETVAANYLAEIAGSAGLETWILEPEPGRGTVIARLRAANPTERPMLLMGHTDVVSVERDQWERDPFGGELVDGFLWGRGALDMKGQVAAELAVLLALKESGAALNRDVIFCAFADEEAGGVDGARWVWEHHRDLIDAEYGINEGGGRSVEAGGHRVYLCQVGEKAAARVRIIVHGDPGHASTPRPNTAFARLGRVLLALEEWRPEVRLTPAVRGMLETLASALDGEDAAGVRAALANPTADTIAALPFPPEILRGIRATTSDTAVPTIVHGGHLLNVIPSVITLDVDCRILPGTDPDEWREQVAALAGEGTSVELLSRQSGVESEPSSPFFEAIRTTISEMDDQALLAPYISAGATDARYLPGIKIYGFFPSGPTPWGKLYSGLVHGHNERIAVEDLGFATRFLHALVLNFAGVSDNA